MELCTKITDNQGYKHRRFAWPRGWRMAFTGKGKRVLPPGFNVWVYSLLLLCLLAVPSLAALNSSGYTAAGAGTAADNGSYALASGVDASGNQFLRNAATGLGIVYNPSGFANTYAIGTVSATGVLTSGSVQYYSGTTTAGTFPLTGWQWFTYGTASGSSVPTFTVNGAASAPTVTSCTSSPSSLAGSGSLTLTVALSGAAPTGGAVVSLSAQNNGQGGVGFSPAFSTVTVPAGSTSAQVAENVTYTAGTGVNPVVITAAYNSTSAACQVNVGTASAPTGAIALSPTSGVSGAGTTLSWSSSGATSVTVTGVSSPAVSGSVALAPAATTTYTLTVTNSAGTNSYTATYTVTAAPTSPPPSGLSVAPNPGLSGQVSIGTVTLSSAAPAGGTVVSLVSTAPITATVPASVFVPAGQTSANFFVTCGSLSSVAYTTLSATLPGGTASQSLIFSVTPAPGGASGTLADGTSSFTPGSGVVGLGAVSVAPVTMPVQAASLDTVIPGVSFAAITIPGLTLPALPGASPITIPGLTIPGVTLPPLTIPGFSQIPETMPGLSLPGISLPGDLKIGIPGLGSIGIPSGWLTQIIAAGINPSAIGTDSLMQSLAVANGKQVFDAGQAVKNAVDSGKYTLEQINTRSDANNVNALNQVQAAVTNTSSVIQGSIMQQTFAIKQTALDTQNIITTLEKTAVTDFQAMLQSLLMTLFVPDPSVLTQFESEKGQFLDWGPYSFVQSFVAAFNTPPGTGSLDGTTPALTFPSLSVNTDLSNGTYIVPPPVPGQSVDPSGAPPVLQYVAPGQWYADGGNIPIDTTSITSAAGWTQFRLFEGAAIWIAFAGGLMYLMWPKQVV